MDCLFILSYHLNFWVDAAYTTIVIINRLLTIVLRSKSLFQKPFCKLFDYTLLQMFGCALYRATDVLSLNLEKFLQVYMFDFMNIFLVIITRNMKLPLILLLITILWMIFYLFGVLYNVQVAFGLPCFVWSCVF